MRHGVPQRANPDTRAASCCSSEHSLAGLTPHELRHTAASLAVSAGANVKAVQQMLGHASATMTLDTYSHLFNDDLQGVAARLDAAHRHQAGTSSVVGDVVDMGKYRPTR